MTAEVVIMNRTAVALAADSAVTWSVGKGRKIYNTVNKLFALSKHQPVGIMLYGGADFMGIPWETVVKVYRAHLGSKDFPKLRDYAADFMDFLETGGVPLSEEDERRFVEAAVRHQYQLIRNRIQDDARKRLVVSHSDHDG
jgi:hypothetical protein